jgi:hypothetical protein
LVWGNFTPTWVDISISAAAVGLFGFLYTLLTKFVPIVSIWEYKEGMISEAKMHVGNADVITTIREESIG